MKMKPNTKYRVQSPRGEPTTRHIPLLALIDDLDSINADLVQTMKHLRRTADATFDLARKLTIIHKEEDDARLP